MKHILLVMALSLAGIGSAFAQTQPQSRPQTRQSQGAPDISPNQWLDAAASVLSAMDGNKAGDLWDGASPAVKKAVQRNAFLTQSAATRKSLGAAANRTWIAVRRMQVASGGNAPAGLYTSVELQTTFAANKVGNELISFRLDEDGTWRFAGYTVH